MNKKLKIILSILAAIITSFVVFFIYLSTQINTENIKKVIVQQIEDNLKGSKANIDKLSYSFGRKITFDVDQLNIDQPSNKALAIKNIKIKVPIYSILTRGGAVDIIINDPNVFLLDIGGKVNWSYFFESETQENKKLKLKLPKFIEESRINLKVNRVSIKFLDENLSVPVDKILLKNISLKKMTAFDISSQLNLNYENNLINVSYDIVGETLLRDFLEGRDTKVNLMMNFNDIKYNSYKIPNTKIKGLVTIDKKQNIKFSLRNDVENTLVGEVKGNYSALSQKLSIETFEEEVSVKHITKYVPELKKQFESFISDDLKVLVQGTLSFDVLNKRLNPFIGFKSLKKFEIKYDDIKAESSFEGSLQEDKFNLEIVSTLLEGQVKSNIKTELNSNLDQIGEFSNTSVDIVASNLKYKFKPIELPSSENTEENTEEENYPELNLPPIAIKIIGIDNQLNDLSIATESNINLEGNEVFIKNFRNIINQKGILAVKGNVKITPEKINLNSQAEITNVNMQLFNSFLPGKLGKIDGVCNGMVKVLGDLKNLSVDGDIKLMDGRVNDLDLNDYILPILSEYNINIDKQKSLNLSSGFEHLNSRFKYNKELLEIKTLNLNTDKNELKLRGNGNLSFNENEKSKIYFKCNK
jgi:hypothetical protein